MPHEILLVLVILLVCLSATSSCTETAFLSVSRARLHQRARHGEKRAITALNLVTHPEPMLTTALLVNTLTNILSSALATSYLVDRFGEVGVAYATVVVTIVVLLFGEAIPKTLGARFSEPIAIAFAPAYAFLVTLFTPVIWIVKALNRGVMLLLGMTHHAHGQFTENDIRGAINLGLQHGTIKRSEQKMLDAVLDLDDLTVADVMIHRSAIAALDINTPPTQVPAVLGALKHSRVPVFENQPDNIIGFLYVRDYLHALSQVDNRSKVTLRTCIRPTYFVPDTSPVGHQLIEFLKNRTHLALVVNEYGDVQGLLTLEDILEEIVGDISDEHDTSVDEQRAADGSVILSGKTHVRDANRRYGWALPEDDAVTLAGLLVDHLHRLPAQGENVTIGPLILTVTSKRGHRIEKIHVVPATQTVTAK